MRIGYARVSKLEQNEDLQLDALKAAGCERLFVDHASGKNTDRPNFLKMLEVFRSGDVLVCWRLDRCSRSLKDLISLVESLKKNGIGFQSLCESIDTTSSGGMLIFPVFGAIAEFERNLIRERTMAGLESARSRGRHGGRRKVTDSMPKKDLALARTLYQEKKLTVPEIMKLTGFKSRSTFYAFLNEGKGKTS